MMKKGQPIYDDSIEWKLSSMLCSLDEYPVVCVNPVEASSYKGFTLAGTVEVFHKYIKRNLYDTFISYMESYKNDCVNAYAVKTHFIPVIKRLLIKYEKAANDLWDSEIRNGWSEYCNEPKIPDANVNITIQAYQFFYNASYVQIFYLGKLKEKFKQYLVELENVVLVSEPEYFFSVMPEVSKHRHNILYDIHKNLNANGYVDCTDEAFKKVFTIKEPKPILWLQSQRSLTYFIKQLTGRFLTEKNKPSNYYIAERYFHIYIKGKFIHPTKVRHDKDPNPAVTEFLDKVIDDAISAYR
jgi:hypothetical protein